MRALLLAALAVLVVAFPTVAGGSSDTATRATANSVTYQDSVGEGGGDPAVPDITTIVVANDDAGLITFTVNISNRTQYGRDSLALLFLDTDNNPSTGEPGLGTDYVIQLLLGEVLLFKWDGTTYSRTFADPPQASLSYSWTGPLTIRISATELGNTTQFGFLVLVLTGLVVDEATGNIDDTNAKADVAPTASLYRYEVKIAPARLLAKKLTTSPNPARAGRAFLVRLTATRSDTGAQIVNGTVACKARIGTKAIKAKTQRFVAGQAACAFTIPAGTQGKRIRGTISIVFEGRKLTRPFTAPIR
jgi:hypothetical protein